MRTLTTVWEFSRPHTIIGSVVSITSLYIILSTERADQLVFLLLALIAGVCSNIFIVGLNQIADVQVDKINKPWLPLPAGKLSVRNAKRIVVAALIISLCAAWYMTPWFFVIILVASAIGWAYSMPPFHLKRHHITAALAISFVRGALVNLGAFFIFTRVINPDAELPANLLLLTTIISVCGIVIAWFKDLPDVKGDAQFKVKTLAVVYRPRVVLVAGCVMMCLSYLLMITAYSSFVPASVLFSRPVLLYGHVILFVLFLIHISLVRVSDHRSVTRFYKRFWFFFFAEYIMYMIAYF